MRKFIYILGIALLMAGCSASFVKLEDKDRDVPEEVKTIIDSNEKAIYINDDIKEVIKDINNLKEKYGDSINEDEYDLEYLHIDIHNPEVNNIKFTNEIFTNQEYFNELVEILDKSIAKGLKEHIKEMENKKIQENEIILRKIDRLVIYTENRGKNEDNYISIKINFSDLKDEYYKDVFNKVSENKYILDNIVMGNKQNMIEFINTNSFYNLSDYDYEYLGIRYNMFLKEENIEKVNILMQGKSGSNIEGDDIDVFANLLSTLELSEEDKSLLLENYKDVFQTKYNNKEIALDNYKVLINSAKGSTYTGSDKKLVYFSIEKA